MGKVRIGFIGAGSMANDVHYPSLSEMEDVEIVGICDSNQKRLKETAEKYQIKNLFSDHKEMIKKVEMEGIHIIMSPHLLFDLVIDSLKARLNVFVEKPPAITLEQTTKMALLAEKNGCKTMVAFNRRYIPLLRKVREIVEERDQIIQAVATFYKPINTSLSYYTAPVDILRSDAIHCLDTLRWLCGEVKQVKSLVRKYHSEVYNTFNTIMEFESGATGILLANWAIGKRVHAFELHAKGVSAFVDPNENGVIYKDNQKCKTISAFEAAGSKEFYRFYGYYQENRHFIDCLKENRQPETSFSDAAKTMELVERIYQETL